MKNITMQEALGMTLNEANNLVSDLFQHRAEVYWTDFLCCLLLGYGSFLLVDPTHLFSISNILLSMVSIVFIYRMSMFTHEISHFRQGQMTSFATTWNLMCGIPLLIPKFMYKNHKEHHAKKSFATENDGEYIDFSNRSPLEIVGYLLLQFIAPLAFVVRFLILAPLSWFFPAVREITWQRFSSLSIDPDYRRPLPKSRSTQYSFEEAGCFLLIILVLFGLNSGAIAVERIYQWYIVISAMLFMNGLRVLAAHKYNLDALTDKTVEDIAKQSTEGNYALQFLDSINHSSSEILGPVWAPIGLRYHAIHHLFPAMPYHGLAEAHQRLKVCTPKQALWHDLCEAKSLFSTLRTLLRVAKEKNNNKEQLA